MTPCTALVKNTLSILDRIPSGIEEMELMRQMEVAHGKPLTTAAARDAIAFCTEKAWLSSIRDEFHQTRYWITPRGLLQFKAM